MLAETQTPFQGGDVEARVEGKVALVAGATQGVGRAGPMTGALIDREQRVAGAMS